MDACETGDLPSSWLLCGVVMVQGKLWLGRETSGLGRLWGAGGLSWAGIELREELVDWRGAIRACKVCYAEQCSGNLMGIGIVDIQTTTGTHARLCSWKAVR